LVIKKPAEELIQKKFDAIAEKFAALKNNPNVKVEHLEELEKTIQKLEKQAILKIKNGEIIQ